MQITSIQFRQHKCFSDQWSGFESIKPINIIIGRNNTGKSQLLELIRMSTRETLPSAGPAFRCGANLDEKTLRGGFLENTSGGDLGGNHWIDHGRWLIDRRVNWTTQNGLVSDVECNTQNAPIANVSPQKMAARLNAISVLARSARLPLAGKTFRQILADRDIKPEPMSGTAALTISAAGEGVTSVVAGFAHDSSLDRDLIRKQLLDALNAIFNPDAEFSEIVPRIHMDAGHGHNHGDWEIFLSEADKGAVALRSSGSGLKTVLLVLSNLLIAPHIDKKKRSEYVLAFEELENNLHPSLLRRLLTFLAMTCWPIFGRAES